MRRSATPKNLGVFGGCPSGVLSACIRRQGPWVAFSTDCQGTKNLAELFAVVGEVFFQNPWSLSRVHPELYFPLRDYYGQEATHWNDCDRRVG